MQQRRHFIHCNIAGFTYYDGPVAFSELKIGTQLQLVPEPENRYDPKAVMVMFGEYKLGYLPRGENSEISKLFEMGYTNLFETRVQRLEPEEYPENQVGIIVYLLRNEVG